MFNLILTKNLYLVEISCIDRTEFVGYDGIKRFFSQYKRYALANKNADDNSKYEDIFTNSVYKYWYNVDYCGEECVTKATAIVTSKKIITKNEALYILEKLNSTYLPQSPKTLTKNKKHNNIN